VAAAELVLRMVVGVVVELVRCGVGLGRLSAAVPGMMREAAAVVVPEERPSVVSLWLLLLRGRQLGRLCCLTCCWDQTKEVEAVVEEQASEPVREGASVPTSSVVGEAVPVGLTAPRMAEEVEVVPVHLATAEEPKEQLTTACG
jgi:hypothetical protein